MRFYTPEQRAINVRKAERSLAIAILEAFETKAPDFGVKENADGSFELTDPEMPGEVFILTIVSKHTMTATEFMKGGY